MAAIKIEFGQVLTETRAMGFTRADKDRILQSFPEKISVSVAGFGAQEFPLRAYVKSFLDGVTPPSAKVSFVLDGDPDDIESVSIEYTQVKMLGLNGGSLRIADTEVSYSFDVNIEPGDDTAEDCPCADGRPGQRLTRGFKLIWDLAIDLEPGVAGVFEVSETEIAVVTPCICPPEEPEAGEGEHDNDDDENRAKKKLKKKGKRDR